MLSSLLGDGHFILQKGGLGADEITGQYLIALRQTGTCPKETMQEEVMSENDAEVAEGTIVESCLLEQPR